MNEKKILKIFRDTGALLEGHFILTSGRHSPSYFQCAKVLQFPQHLTFFAKLIADNYIDDKPDVVISPAIGGVVLGTEVGRLLNVKTIFAERKNGEMCIRRGFNIESNQKFLVVEDVITTGGSVLEVIREDYVRTAKSKGLSKKTVINRHVLKNALIPVVTISGLQFGNLLSGAIAVEAALSIPGLGALLAQGLADRDWMIVQNLVLIFAFLFILINLITDIIYSLIDPRIRYD